jgi:hypothetical protein
MLKSTLPCYSATCHSQFIRLTRALALIPLWGKFVLVGCVSFPGDLGSGPWTYFVSVPADHDGRLAGLRHDFGNGIL